MTNAFYLRNYASHAAMIVMLCAMTGTHALAGPEGGAVSSGSAQISSSGAVTTIRQSSNRAVIDWQIFDVGTQEAVSYLQPGQNAAILNRVTGGAGASQIDGSLSANGQVFVLNPDGVVIGETGRIASRGGFVASSLDIEDTAFMLGGDLRLSGDDTGAVINRGVIESAAGDVVLVAPRIGNFGTLKAEAGTVALGAGTSAWLRPADDQLLHIDMGLRVGGRGVDNQGLIESAQAELKAAGGSVYDLAINQSGTVRATGVERKNGRILLSSGGGSVKVSGTQEARNQDGSGGEIYAGGGFQGQDAAIANAETLTVTETAVFEASASAGEADGGRVILWSDGLTSFEGSITATAGASGGDGGFAEVSGRQQLAFSPALVDLSAQAGSVGTLLLDPDDLLIVDFRGQGAEADVDAGSGTVTPAPESGEWDPDRRGSEILAGTVEGLLAMTNVVLQASGSIYGMAPVVSAAGSTNNLTLTAGEDIYLQSFIDLQGGDLSLLAQGRIQGAEYFPEFPSFGTGAITANRISIGSSGSAGLEAVDLDGVAFSAQVIDLDFGASISGDVSLGSAANAIGQVNLLNAQAGGFSGALSIVNEGGGLTVNGSLAGTSLTGLSIVTDGDLSLGSDFDLSDPLTTGALDLVLASTGGNILSEAPSSAFSGLDASANQRLLAYSINKAETRLTTDLPLTEVTRADYSSAPPSGLPGDGISRVFYLSGLGELTLTADDLSRAYGDSAPRLTFSVDGLATGDTFGGVTSGMPSLSVDAGVDSNVGSYQISISQGDLSLETDTYTGFTFVPGTLLVTPAELIASPVETRLTYGDSIGGVPVTFTGFRNGDTAAGLGLDSAQADVPGLGALPDVGQYDAVFGEQTVGNYRIVDNGATGELVIDPRALTVRLRDRTRTYGASRNFLPADFDGLVRASHEDDFAVTQTSVATLGSDVGSYEISGTVAGTGESAANYDVTVVPSTLTITPAPLRFSVDATSRLYGDANPDFTVTPTGGTTWLNGDDVSDVSLSFSTTAGVGSDVGTYAVSVSGTARNYAIETSQSSAALTVTPAPLTVTADDLTKVYGETADGSWLDVDVTGLKLSDTVADLGPFQANSDGFGARADVVPDGYAVRITGVSNGNYVIASANMPTLDVTPATLDLSVGDASRAYGDSAFTVTGTTADGLMAWDSLADLGLVYTSDISDRFLDAGETRAIDAALGAGVTNYRLGSVSKGTATVTRRQVQGVINSFERYFGATRTPNLLVLGLVNGDTQDDIDGFSFDGLHDVALTDVGEYTVTGTIQDDNYELVSPAQGTMTILPRLITVVVPRQFRTYGDTDALQIEIGNMAPGHDLADVLNGGGFHSDGADPMANVGTYEVTGGFYNPNYEVQTQVLGDVVVQPAPLTIRMSDVTVAYGGTPEASYTLEGLRNGDQQINIFQGITPDYRMSSLELPDGVKENMIWADYVPQVSSDGWMPLSNYSLSIIGGSMEVVRREIIIAAQDILRELQGDWQREELYPGLVYAGGTLLDGQLVNGNALGLVYNGDFRSLVPGQTAEDVLEVAVALDGRVDPDADRKYDISVVGELGDVITRDTQVIQPIDVGGGEIESTTTTYTMDTKIFTDAEGNIVDAEVCENLGKTMVDGICDMGSNEIEVNKAPDVVSPLTAGLMEDLTSEPSDTLVEVFSAYLASAISSGAVDTDMIYLLDDLESGRIDAATFMARALADPEAAMVMTDAIDGYVQALVNADPADLTEAETLLRGRYEYRARRMAERMYWDLVVAKAEDDARRASEDATLGGMVARAPAGYVLDGVLGDYSRDLGDQLLAISGGAGAAAFAGGTTAVPIAFVANTAAQAAPLGAIILNKASTEAAVAAAHVALNKMSAILGGGISSSAAGVAGGVFLTAAVIGVQSGIAQATAANREAELESFMARLNPSTFDPANVPPALHSLIMSELATGANLGGN